MLFAVEFWVYRCSFLTVDETIVISSNEGEYSSEKRSYDVFALFLLSTRSKELLEISGFETVLVEVMTSRPRKMVRMNQRI
ncbi:hypothetical protein Halar_0381 (plasmid) [halophilic archaeon DL31]|nr:hypothetical protein Halar_0381 [halophilic archaeon DL31]